MELDFQLKQVQTLSPQMIQAMEILQMGSQELKEYLEEALLDNPVLEGEPDSISRGDITPERDLLRTKLEWLSSTDIQNNSYHKQDSEDYQPFEPSDPSTNRFEDYLKSQVRFDILPPLETRVVNGLIECLNSCGWLEESPKELGARLGVEIELAEDGIAFLQSLDPAGVGARDLRECLRLQLSRRGEKGLALTIVNHYLEEMGRDHYNQIAKATGESRLDIQAACNLIRSLNPRPASGFSSCEQLSYVIPDLIVVEREDHFELASNDAGMPSLRLSHYYRKLFQETTDPQVKEYLDSKLKQAHWLVKNVEQRRSTLTKCGLYIVKRQENFFRHGGGHLRPMLLVDVAKQLGVHESTISRTIRDKFLQCGHGVFPLGYFFSRGVSTQSEGVEISVDQVKTALRNLIEQENKQKPLSDQAMVAKLSLQGMALSRRTVAKYRDEMGIASTAGRKIFE
ncbi:MAG: RNA polymerase factor sigma-54 [Eubacteriales bacterium]